MSVAASHGRYLELEPAGSVIRSILPARGRRHRRPAFCPLGGGNKIDNDKDDDDAGLTLAEVGSFYRGIGRQDLRMAARRSAAPMQCTSSATR